MVFYGSGSGSGSGGGWEDEAGSVAGSSTTFADDETLFEDDRDYVSRDAVFFCIDIRPNMHNRPPAGTIENNETPFQLAMRAAIELMSHKLVFADTDFVGILLFGVDLKDPLSGYYATTGLYKLDVPDIERIMELETFANDPTLLFDRFPPRQMRIPMDEVFSTAQNYFTHLPKRWESKRLWVFTNDDAPSDAEPYSTRARVKAADMRQQGIRLELFPVGKKDFVVTQFWEPILEASVAGPLQQRTPSQMAGQPVEIDEDVLGPVRPLTTAKQVVEQVNRRQYRKRAVANVDIVVPQSQIQISTYLYVTVREASKPKNVKLSQQGLPVQTQTDYISKLTAATVSTADREALRSYPYANAQVLFNVSELAQMRLNSTETPAITILGFKHVSAIRVSHNVHHSIFCFPSDLRIAGSVRSFVALWSKMIELEVCAIVRYMPRSNSSMRFAAMFPQREEYDEAEGTAQPGGFYLVSLPFTEELRSLEKMLHLSRREWPLKITEEDSEEYNAAKNLVERLTVPNFRSADIPNPYLQRFYSLLKHKALNHSGIPEFPRDLAEPQVGDQLAAAEEQLAEFHNVFAGMNPPASKRRTAESGKGKASASSSGSGAGTAKKRGRHEEEEGRGQEEPKKPKKSAKGKASSSADEDVEDDAVDQSTTDHVKKMWKKDALQQLTVADLKQFLAIIGERVSGKKSDLIDRISSYFQSLQQ